MHPTDEALVAAYLDEDDQAAFRCLLERHQERVFGYLVGMVRDRDVANDLFQETFLRVVRAMRRGSYTRQGKWLPWVMRIARNAALDYVRRRKKWTDVEDGAFWDGVAGDAEPADRRFDRRQRIDLLETCIGRLPPAQRDVVLLRHETDLTFREIAELTEVSINTALGRMRYALINLRKMMEEELQGDAEGIGTA